MTKKKARRAARKDIRDVILRELTLELKTRNESLNAFATRTQLNQSMLAKFVAGKELRLANIQKLCDLFSLKLVKDDDSAG